MTDIVEFNVKSLRDRLEIATAIDDLNDVQNILRFQWQMLDRNQVDANKLRVEIARIKLAKFVPDLKAIEHTANAGEGKVNFVLNMQAVPVEEASPPRLENTTH